MTYVEPRLLTFRHWAGVSPYTSPFGLAETCVFDKQSPGPLRCGPQGHPSSVWTSPHGHPFSQSYRAKLSNSLTRVISFTSGLLPLPTCVGLRYGRHYLLQRGFSRRHRFNGIPQGWWALEFPLPSARSAGTDLPVPAWPTGEDAPCPMGALRLPSRVPPLRYNEIAAVRES